MRKIFLGIACTWLAIMPVVAQTSVHFSSRERIDPLLQRRIDSAKESIDVAIFTLSSRSIGSHLKRAADRGLRLRMLVDPHSLNETKNVALLQMLDPKVQIRLLRGKKRAGFMHHKFAVFDGLSVATGSYNWTRGAEVINYENVMFFDDAGLVSDYQREFDLLWQKGAPFKRDAYSKVRPSQRTIKFKSRTGENERR